MGANDLIRIFYDTYILYLKESLCGFIVIASFSFAVLISFVIFPIRLKSKFSFKRIIGYSFIIGVLLLLHLLFVIYGEQLFLKLDEDKCGILLTKFEGVEERDRFGQFGIRSKFENTIKLLGDPRILKSTQLRLSNKTFKNTQEATEWRDKQRADILIWGFVEESMDSIIYTILYENKSKYLLTPSFAKSGTLKFRLFDKQRIAIARIASIDSETILNWIEAYSFMSLIDASIIEKKYSTAISYLNDFRERFENSIDGFLTYYYLLLWYCNWELGNWEKCIENAPETEKLLLNFEDFPKSILSANYQTIANSYLNLGDTIKAINSFYKCVEYDDRNLQAWKELCGFLSVAGDFSKALFCCKKAYNLDSSDTRVMNNIGVALIGQNRVNEASELLLRFYEKNKENKELMETLILSLFISNEYDSCLYYSNLYLNEVNIENEKVIFFKILCLIRLDSLEESQIYLEKKIPDFPCLYVGYFDLALKYDSLGVEDKAKEFYKKIFVEKRKAWILDCVKNLGLDKSKFEKEAKRIYNRQFKK